MLDVREKNIEKDLHNRFFINKLKKLNLSSQIKEIQSRKKLITYKDSFRNNSHDLQFLNLLEDVLLNGDHKTEGRTKETSISLFSGEMNFDLSKSFPLLTSKKVFLRVLFEELMWMLRGQNDVRILQAKNVHIWDGNQYPDGTIGKGYGYQWRQLLIDQIEKIRYDLKHNPDSRRHIVSAWNVEQLEEMALPPCHAFFQFYVSKQKKLSCKLYQRSADMFLGVPFNIAFYALLTHMLAIDVGLEVGELHWTGGDCHVYDNHLIQTVSQLGRTPIDSPTLEFVRTHKSIYDYEFEDIKIKNYHPHGILRGEMAV